MFSIPPSRSPSPSTLPTEERGFLFQEQETADFRDYWAIVLKYRWTIVAFMLPIVAISIISWLTSAPTYTATATLFIENQPPNILGISQPFSSGVYGGGNGIDYYYKTQVNLLESRSLAARVIHDLGLDQDAQFKTLAAA